jgi:glycyl-tRNA synthetase
MFINFKRLLDYNNGKLPFAAAQVGLGFRNEISPRQGLLRVREFAMAEIEHFVDPQNKDHPKFATIADEVLNMYSAKDQEDDSVKGPTRIRIGDAVANGTVCNETIAYFVTRTNQFLKSVGIKDEAIRFRQHRSNEMAHYANDCWDAEIETSYGWIEVVGHADRSAFDLNKHSEATKTELVASRRLAEPVELTEIKAVLNKAVNGKELKGDNKIVNKFFETAPVECIEELAETMKKSKKITIKLEGKSIDLTEKNVKFEEKKTTTHEEKFTPHVIEPAFGIGRVLYCVFEHCFKMRENDVNRTYFDFPPTVAPLKTPILPLMNNPEMNKKT